MGKGFAVVAEEIRKLAERSGTAAKEIGVLIESSQASGSICCRLSPSEREIKGYLFRQGA